MMPLLVVAVVLDLVSGPSLVTSSSQNLESKANYSCYSCPFSKANSIDMVYNKHLINGDFWYRNGSALASCDFSSIYASERKCSVCVTRAETAVMVLCNLTSGEEPLFEGHDGDISFNKTDCPQPEPISLSERAAETNRRRIGLYISLGCFFALLLLLIIIWLAWKHGKSQKTPADGSSSADPQSGPGV